MRVLPGPDEERESMAYFKYESAFVDEPCEIGGGTKIRQFCHVRKGAKIGQNCNVVNGVVIGSNVQVQNIVSSYTGTSIEDDVLLGPSRVRTNVTNPRSQFSRHSPYEKTPLRRGCSTGANATVVCGVTIGRFAFSAAGAAVTKGVPDCALVVVVPARKIGWMSRHGLLLADPDPEGIYRCPESGLYYCETREGVL